MGIRPELLVALLLVGGCGTGAKHSRATPEATGTMTKSPLALAGVEASVTAVGEEEEVGGYNLWTVLHTTVTGPLPAGAYIGGEASCGAERSASRSDPVSAAGGDADDPHAVTLLFFGGHHSLAETPARCEVELALWDDAPDGGERRHADLGRYCVRRADADSSTDPVIYRVTPGRCAEQAPVPAAPASAG